MISSPSRCIQEKKPGKIRVVFDCSAVFMGVSLNSQLLLGPDLTNSLLGCTFEISTETYRSTR